MLSGLYLKSFYGMCVRVLGSAGCLMLLIAVGCDHNKMEGASEEQEMIAGEEALRAAAVNLAMAQDPVSSESKPIEDRYLKALLDQKEKTGRDNAQIYYCQAALLLPDLTDDDIHDLMSQTMLDGWTQKSQPLDSLVDQMGKAFDEIKKGVAVGHAEGTGLHPVKTVTPMPDFLHLQVTMKMLCVTGKRYEAREQYEEALDQYLSCLIMSHDFIQKDSNIIQNIIAWSGEHFSSKALTSMSRSRVLTKGQLQRVHSQLASIESGQGTIADMVDVEGAEILRNIDDIKDGASNVGLILMMKYKKPQIPRTDINKWLSELDADDDSKIADEIRFVIDDSDSPMVSLVEIEQFPQRFTDEHEMLDRIIVDYYKTPYSQRELAGLSSSLDETMKTVTLLLKKGFMDYDGIDVNLQKIRADLRAAMISVALAQYHLDQGKYPESLDQLKPDIIEALPLDPFIDQNFDYHCDENGKAYRLRSTGPDKVLTDDWAEYAREKGPFSPGDLVY